MRWRHPQLGWVSPADFVPVAEKTGQIVQIGEWVLNKACSDIARLPTDTFLAVNVSPLQLQQGDFPRKLKSILATHGVPPSRLELELTESERICAGECEETLEALYSMGVGFALDDFGTGYSGISYLLSLPVTKIKIDRSFVMDVEYRADSRIVIQNLLRLANGLGLKTTAEGIETESQLEFLKESGCGLAQGYLLGRPSKIEDIQNTYSNLYPRKVS